MIDESTTENCDAAGEEVVSAVDIIADLAFDAAIPGIPAPVRRNLLKALEQLCTSVVDVPIAYLTGKADERRAETSARIQLIETSAEQIAQQMQTDPEYARVAVRKFGQRVIREQVNLDMIGLGAASVLREAGDAIDQSESEESGETLNDDWLNTFEVEARLKSTEDMQAFFSKVLAGEIRKPGSYSTRTIKILGSFDQDVANHFVRLCSLSISRGADFKIVPSFQGNAADNSLQEYGLNFTTLNLLNEHGLVISDYNSRLETTPLVAIGTSGQQAITTPFGYQGRYWMLIPTSSNGIGKKLSIHGVGLTQSGRELFEIVNVEPMERYSQELVQLFQKNGFRMTEVGDGQTRVVSINDVMGVD